VFKDLPTDVMVALLSCLVFEENSRESKPPGASELAAAFQLLRTTATRFAQVFVQSKLNIDQEAYINSYKPGLMEVVYAWAHGAKFSEVCELSNEIYEGVIIRCIRRLHELLRQLRDASKAISSHDLATKFDESIRLIERGIVFAASLYL
jgi:ATP-dependent RNA helicase DOB1